MVGSHKPWGVFCGADCSSTPGPLQNALCRRCGSLWQGNVVSVSAQAWVNILPGMNAGASTSAVPSPIKGSGTAWVLLGSWALSPARPTPIHPRHECRGLSALFGDTAFHATEGDPSNLKLCQRGEWQDRMLVETVLSMLTLVCHFKKVMHRVWEYFHTRLAFTMAAFNVLVQWHGFQPYASGFVPLSMAEFSL